MDARRGCTRRWYSASFPLPTTGLVSDKIRYVGHDAARGGFLMTEQRPCTSHRLGQGGVANRPRYRIVKGIRRTRSPTQGAMRYAYPELHGNTIYKGWGGSYRSSRPPPPRPITNRGSGCHLYQLKPNQTRKRALELNYIDRPISILMDVWICAICVSIETKQPIDVRSARRYRQSKCESRRGCS